MALTNPPLPFPWLSQLLAKQIAKIGHSSSMTVVDEMIIAHYWRSDYIIRVLEASLSIRSEVKEAAIAAVTADPSDATEGLKQLVCILALFETLSAAKKVDFIRAYRSMATLGGFGLQNVVLENVYQWGQYPPQIPP